MRSNRKRSRFVPVIVLCIVIAGMVLVPLKVIGYGYLPADDALRHAAKVISGKDWDEILVLRPEAKMDNHPGWHAILGLVQRVTGCGGDGLVIFSVVTLFLIFAVIPVFFLKRPEAWPAVLLIFAVTNLSFILRLFYGRPYIVTMSIVLILSFIWPKLKSGKIPYKILAFILAMIAIATWIHGSWYLLALPILSFILAREWRSAFFLALATVCGILLGATFSGHPYIFLKNNILHTMFAFGGHALQRMLVGEFQPFTGDPMLVLAVLAILGWRYMRGVWDRKAVDNPIFILMLCSWALGFIARRFWLDWGIVALSAWMALELQNALQNVMGLFSWRRVLLAAAVVATVYLAVTNDLNSRWTQNLTAEYLSAESKEHAPWLPEAGGIIYSDDMSVFYETFFKNPKAPWRYILGFEAGLMPAEDLSIFRNIQWNYGAYQSFGPWVKKMKPADRLILRRPAGQEPNIPGLEWRYVASNIWVGRLPRYQK